MPRLRAGRDRVGGRHNANAALFYDQWYGNAPFDPVAYGAEPLPIDHPVIRQNAESNVERAPDYYRTTTESAASSEFKVIAMLGFGRDDRAWVPFPTFDRKAAIRREIQRLHRLFVEQWSHHLIQADVDALVAHDRLWDFTRVPINEAQEKIVAEELARGKNSWLPTSNGYHPTAAEVNAWSIGGSGHDGCNAGICVKERCKREGVPYACARCAGSGQIWPTLEIERQYEDWTKTDPPKGDGYQLWEDCSEGIPRLARVRVARGAVHMGRRPRDDVRRLQGVGRGMEADAGGRLRARHRRKRQSLQMTASTVRPMKDLNDGVYRYKTYRLEDLIPPRVEGNLIAVKTDGERRAVTYVATPRAPSSHGAHSRCWSRGEPRARPRLRHDAARAGDRRGRRDRLPAVAKLPGHLDDHRPTEAQLRHGQGRWPRSARRWTACATSCRPRPRFPSASSRPTASSPPPT